MQDGWTGPNELPPPPRAPRGTQTNMQPPPPPPLRRPAAPAMIASTGPARNDATWVVTPLALLHANHCSSSRIAVPAPEPAPRRALRLRQNRRAVIALAAATVIGLALIGATGHRAPHVSATPSATTAVAPAPALAAPVAPAPAHAHPVAHVTHHRIVHRGHKLAAHAHTRAPATPARHGPHRRSR